MKNATILIKINLREGFNAAFRFGKGGCLIVASELFMLISLLYILISFPSAVFVPENCLWGGVAILFGNSYLTARKNLFSQSMLVSYLQGNHRGAVLLSAAIYAAIMNLRIVVLFPFILLLSGGFWQGLLLLPPLLCSTVAITTALVILGKRASASCEVSLYLIASLCWIGGVFLVMAPFLGFNFSVGWRLLNGWLLLNLLCVLCIILGRKKLVTVWLEGLRKTFHSVQKKRPYPFYTRMQSLTRNALLLKEWTLLLRNPINCLRIVIWLLLSTALCCLPLPGLFAILSISGLSLLVWVFCFGELIATNWQNEIETRCLYWLAGQAKRKTLQVKILSYLPLIFCGLITAALFSLKAGAGIQVMIENLLLCAILLLTMTALTLLMTMWIPCKNPTPANDILLEQIPRSIGAMCGLLVQLLLILMTFFLPL